MHGGKGGAPKGRRNGRFRHGRRTQEAVAANRHIAAVCRRLYAQAKSLEAAVRELRPLFMPIRTVVTRVQVPRGMDATAAIDAALRGEGG